MAVKTKAAITKDIAADLRKVYMLTFDSFAVSVSDVAPEVDGNTRYARELLATLQQHQMLTLTEDGEGSEAYQVANPGTYDDNTTEDAEAAIDGFLATHLGAKPAKKATANKAASNGNVSADGSPCLCGCGETTGKKSNYRPGHDARHAGNVGRAIAAEYNTPGFDRRDLLAALPSDLLKAKAEVIAEKATAKAAKKDAKPTEGLITVGKNEVAAIRQPDGTVERIDGKAVSKTAAATFQPA